MAAPDPLAEPGCIAFAGDWHANTRWAKTAVRYAADEGADVVVQLGDFGYSFTAEFVRGLDRTLEATELSVLFVDGNHEDFSTLLRYPIRDNGLRQVSERIWHLPRGFRWNWGGVSFLAVGGAHSVDRPWREPGTSWWPQETLTTEDIERAVAGGQADVLLTHDCPAGVPVPRLDESAHLWPAEELIAAEGHRARLRTVVDGVRPRMLWHGHYHRRYSALADFGYGTVDVQGLDCDATSIEDNVVLVPLEAMQP